MFLFFPVVTILYFLLENRFRWILLLLASCWFYMAFVPIYILIILFIVLVDYISGIKIEASGELKRRAVLVLCVAANLGVLIFFKYYNFINENLCALLNRIDLGYCLPHLSIILPIGLSFYVFQSLSYIIEVYRGTQSAERHLGRLALFVMFYPQLVAGPIERPQNLIHQLKEEHKFNAVRVIGGLKLMLWGLFKKIVIADRLAIIVDNVYNHPAEFSGPHFAVATVFFAYQIYCDFSGYSDIAIGVAQVMGIKLMLNFNRPYAARSISEFWKRWHISLSTWFKDYLYIPLGGNRVSYNRWCFNIFAVFAISGIWHGASWTFVAWGVIHGLYMIIESGGRRLAEKLPGVSGGAGLTRIYSVLKVFTVFVLVNFAWIFFRSPSIREACLIVSRLHCGWAGILDARGMFSSMGVTLRELCFAGALIVFLEIVSYFERDKGMCDLMSSRPWVVRWAFMLLVVMLIINFAVTKSVPFLYFQF